MEQKKYIDIQQLQNSQVNITDKIQIKVNDRAFKEGDIISITEKVDGSNACIVWDEETQSLQCFSRRQRLTEDNNLVGFYQFCQSLNPEPFKAHKGWYVFGEWFGNSKRINKIEYTNDMPWLLYSIWDSNCDKWYSLDVVNEFVEEAHKYQQLTPEAEDKLPYEVVKEYYRGPFIDWAHCQSFMNQNFYGPKQEGVVVVNLDKLKLCGESTVLKVSKKIQYDRETDTVNVLSSSIVDANDPESKGKYDEHYVCIVKLVNKEFAESMIHVKRELTPEELAEKKRVEELISQVVTRNRVEKILKKLQLDNILPAELELPDMPKIAKSLNKEVYDDIAKEQPEIMEAAGKHAGKEISNQTMRIVKDMLMGY